MIRSRDFFLFLTTAVFLLIGIGSTVVNPVEKTVPNKNVEFINIESEVQGAKLSISEPSRDTRLAILREKIAAGTTLYSQDIFFEADDVSTSTDENTALNEPIFCDSYALYENYWDQRQIQIEIVGGLRYIYQQNTLATSTETKIPLMVLPVRTTGLGQSNCITSDVIGITTSGALIRNSDASFYKSVSESILLGYALDGYPIYGTSATTADSCGGVEVNGQYRYVLSNERDFILHCYSAAPVSL